MAHPDESSRPLSTGPSTTSTQQLSQTTVSSVIRTTLMLFALSLVACLVAYVAFATPGRWFPSADMKRWSPQAMTVSRGHGELQASGWVVAPNDASNSVIVALGTSLRSSEYPVINWSAYNIPESAQVRLMWRNDYAPARINMATVNVASGHLLPVTLAQDGNWSGNILGLALAIQSPVTQPMLVGSVAAQPMGAVAFLRERFSEWLTFEGWTGASINTVTGGADVQALPLTVLVVLAGTVAALLWLVIAFRRHARVAFPIALGVVFAAAWFVSDARWAWNLTRQVRATMTQYAGKDDQARHLAAEDGALFAFIEHVRAKLPEKPVRIFVAADEAYFRGRSAYHLYPNNVYFDPFENNVPAPGWMHPGDYVVVYHRRGMQFDPANGRLRWDNQQPVRAELLLAESGGALFKLL